MVRPIPHLRSHRVLAASLAQSGRDDLRKPVSVWRGGCRWQTIGRVEQVNSSQIRSSSSFSTLPGEAGWPVAGAGADRLIRVRIVILGGPVFGRRMARHQLWHLHKSSIQKAARDSGNQNRHQSNCSELVPEFDHAGTY